MKCICQAITNTSWDEYFGIFQQVFAYVDSTEMNRITFTRKNIASSIRDLASIYKNESKTAKVRKILNLPILSDNQSPGT